MIPEFVPEEQNILIENRNYLFFFSMDYLNRSIYIDIYNKRENSYVIENHEIQNKNHIKKILGNLRGKTGTTFKKGNVNFLIRNKDISGYETNDYRKRSVCDSSHNNIYDTRYRGDVTIRQKIIPFLKEAWLHV